MKKLSVLFVLWFIVGCAQLGLTQPQSFDQKLAFAYGTHTALLNATASALNAHQIKPDDAKQVLHLADESRALLDAAKLTGDPREAASKLALAAVVLANLQTYLNSHGSKQ